MIKRILLAALLWPLMVLAQTYPSPTFQNVTVLGTMSNANVAITGGSISGISPPIPVASGGTNSASASGTALDNITGFASTGFLTRTGAGAYSFQSLTNGIALGNLVQGAANTVLANATGSTGNFAAFSMPSCSTTSSALNWTSGTGFGCNSSINAATLGNATFAAPGPIGSTTPSTGAFTTLSASSSLTAPTLAVGNNSTGVATTAFVAKHAPCPSIMDNGGDNTGVSDNTTAFATTAGLGPSGQACVYFPPGTYAFSGTVTYTMPTNTASITVLGAGQDVSKLVWAGGGGLQVNFITDANSAHIRDLTFATGTTNAGNGIYLNQTAANTSFSTNVIMSDITNVTVRGNDGYQAVDYWANAINVFGISNVNFVGVDIAGASAVHGVGIIITGDANRVPVQFNIVGCVFSGLQYGFYYGNYVQGVSISASNYTNDGIGVYIPAAVTGLDQLTVTASQFNCQTVDIQMNTAVLQTMIYGNLFLLQTSANGIYLNPSSSLSIVGNTFAPNPGATSTTGITFNNYNALSSVVTGNNFAQLTTGVNLTANAKYVNVQGNSYSGNTNTVVNNCTTGCTVGVATQ